MLVWCCRRNRKYREYDLLKPPYRFYNFLNLTGIFILWCIIVFLSSLMYTVHLSFEKMNIFLYMGLLFISGFIASPLTMLCIFIYEDYIKKILQNVFKQVNTQDEEDEYHMINQSSDSEKLNRKSSGDLELCEGGRPESKEVGIEDMERRM